MLCLSLLHRASGSPPSVHAPDVRLANLQWKMKTVHHTKRSVVKLVLFHAYANILADSTAAVVDPLSPNCHHIHSADRSLHSTPLHSPLATSSTAANQTDAVTANGRTNTLNLVGLATVANATTTTKLNWAHSNNDWDWQAKAFLCGNERRSYHMSSATFATWLSTFRQGHVKRVRKCPNAAHMPHRARHTSTWQNASLKDVTKLRKFQFAFTSWEINQCSLWTHIDKQRNQGKVLQTCSLTCKLVHKLNIPSANIVYIQWKWKPNSNAVKVQVSFKWFYSLTHISRKLPANTLDNRIPFPHSLWKSCPLSLSFPQIQEFLQHKQNLKLQKMVSWITSLFDHCEWSKGIEISLSGSTDVLS